MTLFARLRPVLSVSAAVIVCLLINSCWRQTRELRRPSSASGRGGALTTSAQSAVTASRAYGELPQRFEANRGQTDSRFISRGAGFAIFLKETEAEIRLRTEEGVSWTAERDGDERNFDPLSSIRKPQPSILNSRSTTLRMRLVNANGRPRIQGLDEQPGRSNYFIGGDSRRWITGVPAYSKVMYEQVWPGVDLVWHGANRQLEHDFIVAPGADIGRI